MYPDESIEQLTLLTAKQPSRSDLKVRLARAHNKKGNITEAINILKADLAQGHNEVVLRELENLFKDVDSQLSKLLLQIQTQPKEVGLKIRVARLYALKGNIWQAAIIFKECYKLEKSEHTLELFRTMLLRKNLTTLFFLHIPKTAGTTIDVCLSRSFMPEEMHSINEWEKSLNDFAEMDFNKIKYIHGHIPLSALNQICNKIDIVTLLRDPVDLFVSAFMHIKRSPTHPLYEQLNSNGYTLEKFLSVSHASFQPNLQTSILGRSWDRSVPRNTNDAYWIECLNKAKENVCKYNVTVGFQDNLDKFLDDITLKNGLSIDKSIDSRLVTPSSERIIPTKKERTLIENKCCYDVELYQYFKSLSNR